MTMQASLRQGARTGGTELKFWADLAAEHGAGAAGEMRTRWMEDPLSDQDSTTTIMKTISELKFFSKASKAIARVL